MVVLFLIVAILSTAYGFYSGQLIFALSVVLGYAISMLMVKIVLRPKDTLVSSLFTLFFVIYGALVLLTQMELIHNPMDDFYVHNDAAWSFYQSIMNYVLPCSWGELYRNTIANPLFYHYPLGAYLMGFFGKLGQSLGVIDLRLFMRVHIFILGAFVIATMSNLLLHYGIEKKRVKRLIIPFGLFSYLYITSAIFSRDIHVCLIYALGTYVCLKEDLKYKYLWFILLFFSALGFRPQNGFLFLAYPFIYYYKHMKSNIGLLGVVILAGLFFIVVSILEKEILRSAESLMLYDEKSLSNTGGLFIRFYTLPFPLNTIIMIIYMALQPLPLLSFCVGEGMTWLNVPYIVSPYILVVCFLVCIYYVTKIREKDSTVCNTILVSLLLYAVIIYGSPDMRRAFAAIPGLYMCYGLIRYKIPEDKVNSIKKYSWTIITIINVFFIYYSYIR